MTRPHLTYLDRSVITEDEWAKRDTVKGFGSDRGSVLFAELLLNASRPRNPLDEYALEGELGFRGVGPGSSEVHLWLPGSPAWRDEDFASRQHEL